MTLLVPFDGSDLSEAALERATEFASFMDADLLVLSVVPEDEEYARERGWIGVGEGFNRTLVEGTLEDRAHRIAPDATFRAETPAEVASTASITVDVVRTIRDVADEVDAEIVFVGSENAGRVSTPITSVGRPLSDDPRYDVHIVRHADPPESGEGS